MDQLEAIMVQAATHSLRKVWHSSKSNYASKVQGVSWQCKHLHGWLSGSQTEAEVLNASSQTDGETSHLARDT